MRGSNTDKYENIYELSPIQKGLLFQALYQPESDAYFVQSVFELENLNSILWYKAWNTIINRYDSLRASFIWEKLKNPLQKIHKTIELQWTEEDWSAQIIQKYKLEKKLKKLIQDERKIGFNLGSAPLIRFNLIKVNSNNYYFIWNAHHLLLDGWSGSIILNEVIETYNALISNRKVTLKERKSYRDYISWLLKQDKDKAEKYWQERLVAVICLLRFFL